MSPRSGAVFERKLIESYIATSGTDPINDQPLAQEDLIAITSQVPVVVPPKPPAFNSIPTMLAAFQNEWDALALETFSLRKQLHTARLELSAALYQYDAAVRVAAKAIRERDEAQQAVQQLSESFANGEVAAAQTNGNGTLREIPVDSLNSARDILFALHKKQKLLLPVSRTSEVSISTSSSKHPLTEVTSSIAKNGKLVLVSKNQVELYPEGVTSENSGVLGSAFLVENGEEQPLVIAGKEAKFLADGSKTDLGVEVKAIVSHPSEPYFVVLTQGDTWALCDREGLIYQSEQLSTITAADVHVDGILMAIGTGGGEVKIYDLTTTEVASTVTAKYSNVEKLQFGLNGYWLVVASSEDSKGAVQLFDLRKNVLSHELLFEGSTDFALDPSCLVLVTYTHGTKALQAHLYIKKGKSWVDQAAEVIAEAELKAIHMASNAEDIKNDQVVKVVGVSDEEVVNYEIAF